MVEIAEASFEAIGVEEGRRGASARNRPAVRMLVASLMCLGVGVVLLLMVPAADAFSTFYGPTSLPGDVVANGVGVRATGTGDIALSGVPAGASIVEAHAYWVLQAGFSPPPGGNVITFAGTPTTGTVIGTDGGLCWSGSNAYGYRANVTSLVTGSGTYSVAVLSGSGVEADGVSLVVVYDVGSGPWREVVIVDGYESLVGTATSVPIPRVAGPSPATSELIVMGADGQAPFAETMDWNSGLLASNSWDGSDPMTVSSPAGSLWDTDVFTVSSNVGMNTLDIASMGDCIGPQAFTLSTHVPAPPTVDFTCGHETHPDWLEAWFRGVAVDPDDNVVSWEWDLGDGNSAATENVTHTYAAEGWYTVTVTVTDADGLTASATHDCFADGNAPPVISAPARITVYERDTVAFPVTGGDPDGDPLVWQWRKSPRLPWHASIDMSGPRTFSWTTLVGEAGLYGPIEFSVKDPYWPAATAETMIHVVPTPPVPGPENADTDGDGEIDGHDACPMTRADCETGLPPEPDPVPHQTRTTTTTTTTPPVDRDTDVDGVFDALDNCPQTVNRGQGDLDADGLGDACDPDVDGDRVPEADAAGRPLDNCPFMPNPLQLDEDEDGVGDDCQGDLDSDGVPDGSDNCLRTPNPLQEDADGDGVGDACTASEAGGQDGGGDDRDDPDADVHGDVSGSGMAWAAAGLALGVLAAGLVVLVAVRRRLRQQEDASA